MAVHAYQGAFSAGEMSDDLFGRIDLDKYQSGAKRLKNFIVHAHGGVSNRPGTRFVAAAKDETEAVRLIPFLYNKEQAYVLEMGHQYCRVISDGGVVLKTDDSELYFTSPYSGGDLARVKFCQSADTIYMVHPSYPVKKLVRSSAYVWAFETVTWLPTVTTPSTPTGSISPTPDDTSTEYKYKITAVDSTGQESLPSGALTVDGPEALVFSTSTGTDTYRVNLSWTAVSGASHYNVYKYYAGSYGWMCQADSNEATDENIKPDMTATPPGAEDPFSDGYYPGAIGFFQQRLGFGGESDSPQTLKATRTGNFENYSMSSPTRDDDALEFTLVTGDVQEIRHFVQLSSLILLTSGGEWVMDGGGDDSSITPTSVRVKAQTYYGASHVRPIVSGGSALYVQEGGDTIRDLAYDLASDAYKGNDLTILVRHLFDNHKVVDWAWQRRPWSVVWCVRSDGALLSLTYVKEQNVWAWSHHETDGEVESVATVPNEDESTYDVYFVVKRTVNGSTRRYIEQLAKRLPDDDIEQAFFVDSGLSYDGADVTTLSGLSHLEGKEVAILADGAATPRQTVLNGSITLPHTAGKVHVGLPYEAVLETLSINFDAQDGSVQGRRKFIAEAALRLKNTRGFFIGRDEDHLDEMKARSTEAYGDPIAPFTGDVRMTFSGSWGREGRFVVKQRDPLPITILAVMPKVELGDR